MKRAVSDTSRAPPLKIHPSRITTLSPRFLVVVVVVVSRHFSCLPDGFPSVEVRDRRLDRPTPLPMVSKNPWMRPMCLQSSFRDKDETMIDRRREGSLERREIILFFYIYPVDTSTGIDS